MTHDRMLSCDKIMSKYSPESWSTNVLLSQQDVKWRNPQCKQIMIKYQRNYRPDLQSNIRWTLAISPPMRRRSFWQYAKINISIIGKNYLRRPVGGGWGECPLVTCHRSRSQSIARLRLRAPTGRVLSAPGPQRVRDKTEYCSFDAGLWRDSRAKVLRRFRPSAGRVN